MKGFNPLFVEAAILRFLANVRIIEDSSGFNPLFVEAAILRT